MLIIGASSEIYGERETSVVLRLGGVPLDDDECTAEELALFARARELDVKVEKRK